MRVAAALLAIALGLPVAALADDTAPLDPEIAQCVRDNAASVEAAVPDLNAGVDFLTSKVCAEPVAKLNTRTAKRQQDRMADYWKDLCDKQKASGKKPAQGTDWCSLQGSSYGILVSGGDDEESGLYGGLNTNPPAAATALAARLLLDLRLAHQKQGK